MKKLTGKIILLLCIISACSKSPSLELTEANVTIVNDKELIGSYEISEGKRKGKELVPTALYYEFKIKNTGNETAGNEKKNEDMKVKIKPKEKLQNTTEKIIGFNIFSLEEYDDTGLGYGETYPLIIPPHEEEEFTLHYDVGVSEEEPTIPVLVPTDEQLDELLEVAFDAELVVIINDVEVANFDLNKFKKE